MREKYRLRAMDRADWLDPASLSRVDRLVAALADPDELRKHRAYQTDAEASLRDSPKLVLEMPCFAHPIIHEERPYPGVPGGVTGAGGGGGSAIVGGAGAGAGATQRQDGGGRAWGASDLLAGGGSDAFLLVSDYEMEEDNPVEHKYRKLAHDQLRGLVDPELKPNRDERHRIDDLVAGRQDHLSMEDKDLLWKFRYCLTDNKRALTKLLLSVDWGVDSEVAQVENLLAEWARRAPIDAPDALKLLGRERTFQAEVVRRFAVDALRRASDDELLAFLLQLVQALRYQPTGGGAAGPGAGGDMLLAQDQYVQAVARAHQEACDLNARWWAKVWAKDERLRELLKAPNLRRVPRRPKVGGSGGGGGGGAGVAGGVAEALMAEFGAASGGGGGSVPMPLDPTVQITGLEPSTAFLFKSALYPCVIEFTVKRDATSSDSNTTSAAAAAAADTATHTPAATDGNTTAVPNTGTTGSTAAVTGAAVNGHDKDKDGGTAAAAAAASSREVQGAGSAGRGADPGGARDGGPPPPPPPPPPRPSPSASSWLGQAKPKESSYKVIFKSGDDLRQDQLVMQMISLMDSLLKRVNLDLKLKPYGILATGPRHGLVEFVSGSQPVSAVLSAHNGSILELKPYGILATGPRHGLVEFVSGSQPVSAVLSAHNGSILEYLRHHNPDPSAPNGVRPAAVQTFVKSTAGYCVITYLGYLAEPSFRGPASTAPSTRMLQPLTITIFVTQPPGSGLLELALKKFSLNQRLRPPLKERLAIGNLFHIDFGYIFGRDAKPGATPIRFTQQMADAMGGVNSEDYRMFKTYCCQAYNWLRKSANLILNLLSLMSDAGISDLSDDPVAALAKVEDNFRLDLTDEMVGKLLIDTSLQALAPRVIELLHQIRVAGR
ncbi:unnamed protein product [Ectocarpus sp. CCAP 1310/34]|nr:unnamed protein product [Ectocarpus sp. CCAP 1310/34]